MHMLSSVIFRYDLSNTPGGPTLNQRTVSNNIIVFICDKTIQQYVAGIGSFFLRFSHADDMSVLKDTNIVSQYIVQFKHHYTHSGQQTQLSKTYSKSLAAEFINSDVCPIPMYTLYIDNMYYADDLSHRLRYDQRTTARRMIKTVV